MFQETITAHNPENEYVKPIGSCQIVLAGVLVLGALVTMSIIKLAPGSVLGEFLSSWFENWYGWVSIPVILLLIGLFMVVFESKNQRNRAKKSTNN